MSINPQFLPALPHLITQTAIACPDGSLSPAIPNIAPNIAAQWAIPDLVCVLLRRSIR